MTSPYDGIPESQWQQVTNQLAANYPLGMNELVRIVKKAWQDIFQSQLGTKPYLIGKDVFPKPQIMGFLLEEFTCLDLAAQYPAVWRAGKTATEKDLVYKPDDAYSIEMKTSSSGNHIYGNRSYAQPAAAGGIKKNKSGYYLTVNFQPFTATITKPALKLIRFGWLDHADWQGQKSATGQQAKLSSTVEQNKLLVLYDLKA